MIHYVLLYGTIYRNIVVRYLPTYIVLRAMRAYIDRRKKNIQKKNAHIVLYIFIHDIVEIFIYFFSQYTKAIAIIATLVYIPRYHY